jgi:hypothetical protein
MSEEIVVEDVPRGLSDLAERRTRAIRRSCLSAPDALSLLVRSCYLQGLIDGHHAATSGAASRPGGEPQ